MKIKKKWIVALLCGLTASISLGVGMATAGSAPVFEEVRLEAGYKVGDTFDVPTATLSYNGQEQEVEGVVVMPNGEVKDVDSLVLKESGKYQIIYKAVVNGKVLSKTVDFNVMNALISSTGNKSSVSYGTNSYLPESYKGLNVRLAADETLKFNKVIDIAELTKNRNILKFYMTPQYKGSGEVNKLFVRLTDIYNPDNYVTVVYTMFITQANWGWHWMYTEARASNQDVYRGLELLADYNGDGAGRFYDPEVDSYYNYTAYGMPSAVSWNGVVGDAFWHTTFEETNYQCIKMDLETKEVFANFSYYTSGKSSRVTDLDNSVLYGMNLWEGFTTGEVTLSMWGQDFAGNACNMFVTEIGGHDLSACDFQDTQGPAISVDYGRYGKDRMPKAYVNSTYQLFDATAYDIIDGYVDVTTKVYMNYYGSTKVQVPVKDGKFAPKRVGEYTIVYSARDSAGNVSEELIDIHCIESDQKMNIDVDKTPLTVDAGLTLNVPNYTVKNANGYYDFKIQAVKKADNSTYEINPKTLTFTPVDAGEYEIVYIATDYSDVVTEKVSLTVNKTDMPALKYIPEIPRFFIKGCGYTFDAPTAYDFSGQNTSTFDAKVYVKEDGGAEQEVTGSYVVAANKRVDVIIKADNGKATYTETIATIPVVEAGYGDAEQTDISSYMQGDGFTATATETEVTYKKGYTASTAKLQLINKALVNDFGFKFSYVEDYDNFQNLTLKLIDIGNPNNVLMITFEKKGDTVTYYFNGNKAVSYSFIASYGKDIILSYKVGTNSLVVNNDLTIALNAIKAFGGFESDYAYFDVEFGGIEQGKDIALAISYVCNQDFNSGMDFITPVLFGDKASNRIKINQLYTIKAIDCYDLIDPNVSAKLKVTYRARFVTANDGTELKGVSPARDYELTFTEYGTYTITYTWVDYAGNSGSYSYSLYVIDLESPTLEFNGTLDTEYKVGDEVRINDAVISDNISEGIDLKVHHFLRNPDGTVESIELSFKATMVGEYEIYYYLIDKAGNVAIYSYIINVK